MTNKELQVILSKYTSDIPLQVSVGGMISDIVKIDKCVDMDTNKVSLVVYGQDRDYFKKGGSQLGNKQLALNDLKGIVGKSVYSLTEQKWYVIDYIDEIDELCSEVVMTDLTRFISEDGDIEDAQFYMQELVK